MTDKITIDRVVVEQALDMFERGRFANKDVDELEALCDVLCAALEQTQVEQEPHYGDCDECGTPYSYDPTDGGCICVRCVKEKLAAKQQVEQEPPPNGATHKQPKQGAFYKRVDGKWYVWSRMKNDEPHRWYISPGTTESCLEPLYTYPQNLNCKSTQHRLATLWGYEKPQPHRQPLTDEQIMAIGRELGLKCRLGGNPNIDFDYARAIEAAHGIKENKHD